MSIYMRVTFFLSVILLIGLTPLVFGEGLDFEMDKKVYSRGDIMTITGSVTEMDINQKLIISIFPANIGETDSDISFDFENPIYDEIIEINENKLFSDTIPTSIFEEVGVYALFIGDLEDVKYIVFGFDDDPGWGWLIVYIIGGIGFAALVTIGPYLIREKFAYAGIVITGYFLIAPFIGLPTIEIFPFEFTLSAFISSLVVGFLTAPTDAAEAVVGFFFH